MPEEERKSTIQSRKEKNSFVKATSTGVAPRWRPDFELRSHRQIKICHTLCEKRGFPFLLNKNQP